MVSWQGSLPKIILENNTARVKGDSIYVTAVDIHTEVRPSTFWSIFTIHSVNHPLEIFMLVDCVSSLSTSMVKPQRAVLGGQTEATAGCLPRSV